MLRSLIASQVIFILLLAGCTNRKQEIIVSDLRCENLSDPLGINTTKPRLSWKIKSEINGTSQQAFQILAASDISLLDEKNADLWNSGKTVSSSGVLIPYQGKELQSRSLCYWKVRIWNEQDVVTEWSSPALFSVGLLNKSDWYGSYIGFSNKGDEQISPQLRDSFNITGSPSKVFMHVNSLGYHEIYLNGTKVGGRLLAPAVSQFNKRSLAITYDLTSLTKEGRNDVVIWLGKGWYTDGLPGVGKDGPLVRAEIDQLLYGKWDVILTTDSSWTGRMSGYKDTGTWRPHKFGGEIVDGSLLPENLSATALDEYTWTAVTTPSDPGFDVSPQMTEPNRIMATHNPDTIYSIAENIWFVDMGTTMTGFFEMEFPELNKGEEIIIQYSDHLDKNGKFADQGQEDRYIASGRKNEIFRNKFNYHGFRYVRISNLRNKPSEEDITASLIHTDFKTASAFECSDEDINRIHDMINYTLRCLSLGGYLVDCPQIERLGYGGDGNASTPSAQLMFNLDPLYSNWLQAWADCIRDDGGMPHTAPNPYTAGGGPYWCGFLITASWNTYQNYGDIRVLEKYYPAMKQWLGYVEKYSPEGLLKKWPDLDYRGWYLGDWAVPEGTDQKNESSVALVNNCFVAVCYETMAKIAAVIGKNEDTQGYIDKNKNIKGLINMNLYNSISKTYGSGSQIDLTYPMLAGVVPDSIAPDVRKNLFNEIIENHNGHFATGLVGIPVFTEWSVKNRESDLMYSMLKKRDYPSYLYMIDNGATTTWEHWNGARSRIHNCYNGIGTWFYQAVGGIRADEKFPAYKKIIIDPQVPEGINWANCSKETPYGTVSVRWILEDDLFKIDIKIPVSCTSKVMLPEGINNFKLNGKRIKSDKGYIETESGNYQITYRL